MPVTNPEVTVVEREAIKIDSSPVESCSEEKDDALELINSVMETQKIRDASMLKKRNFSKSSGDQGLSGLSELME